MISMNLYDRLRQIALYLLCWPIYPPEWLCFISNAPKIITGHPSLESVSEGLYLKAVIEVVDGM